jgi:hypothetical protein
MVFPGDASQTWHAIEYGLQLLKRGIIWRVGTGSKIQIWRDQWIPRPPSLKITLKKGRMRLRWVSQLMKPGQREWDVQRLQTCMYPHDIEEILKIRLSNTNTEDILAWHYEKTRLFSVRSAYRLALQIDQEEKRRTGSNTMPDGTRPIYKNIWSAHVPPKVRIFAWRLSQEGLSTQLSRKHWKLT